jgi:hypothetical protein
MEESRNIFARARVDALLVALGGFVEQPDYRYSRPRPYSYSFRDEELIGFTPLAHAGRVCYGGAALLAERLGRSPNQIRVKIHRMRKQGKLPLISGA